MEEKVGAPATFVLHPFSASLPFSSDWLLAGKIESYLRTVAIHILTSDGKGHAAGSRLL